MPSLPRFLRCAVAATLALLQGACVTSRHLATHEHADYIRAEPSKIWVTRQDGVRIEVNTPKLVMDTLLTGWASDGATFIGMPLSEVKTVTVRQPAPRRTIGLFLGLAVAAVVGILLGGHTRDTQTIEED